MNDPMQRTKSIFRTRDELLHILGPSDVSTDINCLATRLLQFGQSGLPFFTERRQRSTSVLLSMMPLSAAGNCATRVSSAESFSITLAYGLTRRRSGVGAGGGLVVDPAADGPDVVAEMHVAGRLDPREHARHGGRHYR